MKKILNRILSLAMLLLVSIATMADGRQASGYRNPILYADVPDVSLVHVGKYYYMVSTTMHLMPGCPVMRSKDLKTWQTVSYVFPRIDDAGRYSLIDSTAYGQGQWASSIRYHKGRFYVWFTANGSPYKGFIYTAKKAEGPWTLVARPPHFHDGSLFFDDDDRVYMFHGTGHLTELTPDLQGVKKGGIDQQIFERDKDEQGLLEGSSVIKHNGKYYLCMISMDWSIPGRVRREVCYRADKITGPYEKHIILETPFEEFGGVGQGCLVPGDGGEWWAVIFQDRGGVGRVPCLMPVTWKDGWPMCGAANGKVPNDLSVPYQDMSGICGSDDFSSKKLKLYWQWNHNPIDEAWSLTERRGFLRLKTARVVPNLFVAPNTISERMPGPASTGTVKLDVSNMRDGDVCGLAAFNGLSGELAILRTATGYMLQQVADTALFKEPGHAIAGNHRTVLAEVPLDLSTVSTQHASLHQYVWLRCHADFRHGHDLATFAYSTDGKTFHSIGQPVKMVFNYRQMFMGSRYAIFNYATSQTGGYVDVDSFDLQTDRK